MSFDHNNIRCPYCGSTRFFASPSQLRTHIADRHPWHGSLTLEVPNSRVSSDSLSDEVFAGDSASTMSFRSHTKKVAPLFSVAGDSLNEQLASTRSVPDLYRTQYTYSPNSSLNLSTRSHKKRPWYDDPTYEGPRVLGQGSEHDCVDTSSNLPTERLIFLEEELDNLQLEKRAIQQNISSMSVNTKHMERLIHTLAQKEREIEEKERLRSGLLTCDDTYAGSRDGESPEISDKVDFLIFRAERAEEQARQLKNALQTRYSLPSERWLGTPQNSPRSTSANATPSRTREDYYQDQSPTNHNQGFPLPELMVNTASQQIELSRMWHERSPTNSATDNADSLPSQNSSGRSGGIPEISEALLCVFLYLDTKELVRVGGVDKLWRHVSHNHRLWRRIKMVRARVDKHIMSLLIKRARHVESITFHELQDRALKSSDAKSLHSHAKRGRALLEPGLEALLRQNSATIRCLKVIDCGALLTEHCLWLLGCHCARVERVVYLSACDPVGAEVLWALGRGCPRVHTLVVPPMLPNDQPDKFTDQCCRTIADSWNHLLVLCVGGKQATPAGLVTIASHCPRLRHLELDHFSQINEQAAVEMTKLGLRGLENLDFTFTPVTPKAIVQFNSACPKLKRISVHAGISDYFKIPSAPRSKSEFQNLFQTFQIIKKRPGFSNVLDVRLDYG